MVRAVASWPCAGQELMAARNGKSEMTRRSQVRLNRQASGGRSANESPMEDDLVWPRRGAARHRRSAGLDTGLPAHSEYVLSHVDESWFRRRWRLAAKK